MGLWVGVVGVVFGTVLGAAGVATSAYFFFAGSKADWEKRLQVARSDCASSIQQVKDDARDREDELSRDLSDADLQLQLALKDVAIRDAQLAVVQTELEGQLAFGQKRDGDIASLEAKLEAVTAERDAWARRYAGATKERANARASLEAVKGQIEEIRTELQKSQESETALTKTVQTVEQRADQLASRKDALDAEAAREQWNVVVETAVNGSCKGKDFVTVFEKCDREVRGLLAPHAADAVACYLHGYSGALYLEEATAAPPGGVRLRRGAVAVCDRTLRDAVADAPAFQ